MPPRYRIPNTDLSAPERYALLWKSHGLRTKMVAEQMGIERSTVISHLASARMKLCAKNTAHAVANAFRAGIIR